MFPRFNWLMVAFATLVVGMMIGWVSLLGWLAVGLVHIL
jgi:hypothetical protein